ncbi:hypothetical protein STSP2_00087 [Anaerohalosphaera lusitana]|uniref:Transcription factor zinc-finger domain-containing protein n=1 Tax=Anaerohalosphaera lusitana TaxID=1936003 RepID=A0A1U9NG93_9BACT|nr:zf-TFIIB domain-containing protein [Anaerohalosphaera lusitana]AQT66949.1 hypothetical protein STSP2_00087 [Anaerohalosphaera lusitana]
MQCPVCSNGLKKVNVEGIELDVCDGGCGGIWFDSRELDKVDNAREAAGEQLLDIQRKVNISADQRGKIKCPRCMDITMMKHFYSVNQSVEVDECGGCGGFWLDYGELGQIRDQYETEEEKKAAAKAYFDEVFGEKLAKMRVEEEAKQAKARKIASFFRFICPSWYVPGKQKWGAF